VLESLVQLEKFFAIKDEIGFKDATLYLNVSAHTIMHPEFCSIFTDFVEKHNLAPNQFGLEVTETAELADINIASESLQTLKNKGIKIALDDFGAGYASLKYVRDLPIDVVKLDKHFTFNVTDPSTARLISFVSEVCSDLDLEMIGEGIETEEDRQLMLDLGCKIGQGYLMHRPDFLDSFKVKEV
jgi:EAL domain-containing protein (putative c-di-GMP-specific phosphodiesterase class I)